MIKVYLAGEIHTNWREDLIQLCNSANLKTQFFSPVTNHENSDNCGVEILGPEDKNFWKDNKGANINSIRTKKAIKDSDVVVVKFMPWVPLVLSLYRQNIKANTFSIGFHNNNNNELNFANDVAKTLKTSHSFKYVNIINRPTVYLWL